MSITVKIGDEVYSAKCGKCGNVLERRSDPDSTNAYNLWCSKCDEDAMRVSLMRVKK